MHATPSFLPSFKLTRRNWSRRSCWSTFRAIWSSSYPSIPPLHKGPEPPLRLFLIITPPPSPMWFDLPRCLFSLSLSLSGLAFVNLPLPTCSFLPSFSLKIINQVKEERNGGDIFPPSLFCFLPSFSSFSSFLFVLPPLFSFFPFLSSLDLWGYPWAVLRSQGTVPRRGGLSRYQLLIHGNI